MAGGGGGGGVARGVLKGSESPEAGCLGEFRVTGENGREHGNYYLGFRF